MDKFPEMLKHVKSGLAWDDGRQKILLVGRDGWSKTGSYTGFVKKGRKYPRGGVGGY